MTSHNSSPSDCQEMNHILDSLFGPDEGGTPNLTAAIVMLQRPPSQKKLNTMRGLQVWAELNRSSSCAA